MGAPLHRQDRLERITGRIGQLGEQAASLLERERDTSVALQELRRSAEQPGRWVRKAHLARAIARAERRLARMQTSRAKLAEEEIRTIMLALQDQSHRTRERLDRALDRLAPVEAEWERLRSTFDALETAIAMPALEQLAGHWQGGLQIPEFPVAEREGYAKPFPHKAVVF
jgi:chromosome segregation ATPase